MATKLLLLRCKGSGMEGCLILRDGYDWPDLIQAHTEQPWLGKVFSRGMWESCRHGLLNPGSIPPQPLLRFTGIDHAYGVFRPDHTCLWNGDGWELVDTTELLRKHLADHGVDIGALIA